MRSSVATRPFTLERKDCPDESLDALSDEDLMGRYQGGAARAFQTLFRRHAPGVFSYFVQSTGDRPLAEDLLQQTWLQVHRGKDRFRAGARFTPWLYTIAANLRRNSARDRTRSGARLTADGTLPEPPAQQRDWDGQEHPDERTRAVRDALGDLPQGYRDVILLHRWHELGFAEIAAVLGTTEGAVKLRAHRGYQRLRELLAQRGVS